VADRVSPFAVTRIGSARSWSSAAQRRQVQPNGGTIVVGVSEADDEVTVWVRDPGIGVPRPT